MWTRAAVWAALLVAGCADARLPAAPAASDGWIGRRVADVGSAIETVPARTDVVLEDGAGADHVVAEPIEAGTDGGRRGAVDGTPTDTAARVPDAPVLPDSRSAPDMPVASDLSGAADIAADADGIAGFDGWGETDGWDESATGGDDVAWPCQAATPCDDDNVCTLDECDAVKGCKFTPVAQGTACDDGVVCSVQDACANGTCDPGPDALWDIAFGGPKGEAVFGIAARADGSVVMVGRVHVVTAPPKSDAWVIALGPGGKAIWSTVADAVVLSAANAGQQSEFRDVATFANGGGVAVGYVGVPPGDIDGCAFRFDAQGKKLGALLWGTAGTPDFLNAVNISGPLVFVAGAQGSNGGDGLIDVFPAEAGAPDPPAVAFGGVDAEAFNDVAVIPGGGVLAAGDVKVSNGGGAKGTQQGFLVRTTADLKGVWQVQTSGTGNRSVSEVLVLAAGFLAVGRTWAETGGSAMWLLRLDAGGQTLWQQSWSEAGSAAATGLVALGSGFLVVGHATVPGSATDGWLLWVNGSGGVVGAHGVGGAKDDEFLALAQTGGALVAAGTTNSKGSGQLDAWMVRMDMFGNASCDNSGTCLGQANSCDDANACTADLCSAKGGCIHAKANDGTVCGTLVACTGGNCGP